VLTSHAELELLPSLDLVACTYYSDELKTKIDLSFDSIFSEWNPDTIIALHDFVRGGFKCVLTDSAQSKYEVRPPSTVRSQMPAPEQIPKHFTSKQTNAKDFLAVVTLRCFSVCFNKERSSVHLAIARMDDASVTYWKPGCNVQTNERSESYADDRSKDEKTVSARAGDMRVRGTIGNLTLIDVSTPGSLYSEILGLQRSAQNSGQRSNSLANDEKSSAETIDDQPDLRKKSSLFFVEYTSYGTVHDLDYGSALTIHLSPVRVVYIHQYVNCFFRWLSSCGPIF
jgi:hypothetical protein